MMFSDLKMSKKYGGISIYIGVGRFRILGVGGQGLEYRGWGVGGQGLEYWGAKGG